MSTANAIYIYIRNNTPVILNVDNATDGAVLEELGAIKMPEAMASEVFGENIQYADNTTCTITDNPDNPAFPYTVTFNANKIPEKQKRNTSVFVYMNQPSEKYIDVPVSFHVSSGTTWTKETTAWTAPANGFIYATSGSNDVPGSADLITAIHYALILNSENIEVYSEKLALNHIMDLLVSSFILIKKGYKFQLSVKNNIPVTATIRFYYAEGEL